MSDDSQTLYDPYPPEQKPEDYLLAAEEIIDSIDAAALQDGFQLALAIADTRESMEAVYTSLEQAMNSLRTAQRFDNPTELIAALLELCEVFPFLAATFAVMTNALKAKR